MRFWGIDLGKEVTAAVCRDETGGIIHSDIYRDAEAIVRLVELQDAVAVEWTGGRARPLLEKLWEKGVTRLYLYNGGIEADRRHLGYGRKGDLADASTIAYALYASLTPGVPFRPNAFTDYAQMREVYALRAISGRIDALVKLKVQTSNLKASAASSGADDAAFDRVLRKIDADVNRAFVDLRVACVTVEPVRRLLRVLASIFPGSDRAIYSLAVQIAPLERFATGVALQRYCGVLPMFPESGGRPIGKPRWRGGNRRARTALYNLIMAQITAGNGGNARGRWRNYYENLRRRYSHGEAMIRMMKRLLAVIYREYFSGIEGVDIAHEKRLRVTNRVQQRKEQVIDLIREGFSDAEAARAVGIHPSNITVWKRRDPYFLERYIRARIMAKEGGHGDQRQDSGGDSPVDGGGNGDA